MLKTRTQLKVNYALRSHIRTLTKYTHRQITADQRTSTTIQISAHVYLYHKRLKPTADPITYIPLKITVGQT